jgi:UDP-N-acetylmuramate--alanine ligase
MTGFENIKQVYFLGIGGIGMSALARFFRMKGKEVSGYDRTPTSLTDELISEGISITFDDAVSQLPDYFNTSDTTDNTLVIYTPAIPSDHRGFNHLKSKGIRLWKRSEVLGMLTRNFRTIAVAGTHGKTTTSTMIAHILRDNGVNCTAFLGGISTNYNTNFLMSDQVENNEVVVVEADEYDRSFLTLYPSFAIVTSLDADHLDIYSSRENMISSYQQFADQVQKDGMLIYRSGLELAGIHPVSLTYSLEGAADFTAREIEISNAAYHFNIVSGDRDFGRFTLTWPGRHNVENAIAAFAVCHAYGLDPDQIRQSIKTFKGVRRRFEYRVNLPGMVMIDDYAHHPTELRAAIRSARELYPGKKLLGIFQPHLFTRTRDFADEFASSLSELDELILMNIYPARELPIPGVNSNMILEKVQLSQKQLCSESELLSTVNNSDAEVILTLGAGDIDKQVPGLAKMLQSKVQQQ